MMAQLDHDTAELGSSYFFESERDEKLACRQRRLLGLWAAKQMHLSDEASLLYALNMVKSDLQPQEQQGLIDKILADMAELGVSISADTIHAIMIEFNQQASSELALEG